MRFVSLINKCCCVLVFDQYTAVVMVGSLSVCVFFGSLSTVPVSLAKTFVNVVCILAITRLNRASVLFLLNYHGSH